MKARLLSRRAFLCRAAFLVGASLTAGATPAGALADAALKRARRFLRGCQHADGAWRSVRYGPFRDGDALTPLVLWALVRSGSDGHAIDSAVRWLQELTSTQAARSEPWSGLTYPLFTAGYAAQVFARRGDRRRASFWAHVIEKLRLSPSLGWPADSPSCGAWSDAPFPPRLISGNAQPADMLAPNLSATLLALQGLTLAGRGTSAAGALPFIEKCQNLSSEDESFDDGGFFFAPDDSVRNKAGVSGRDAVGRQRFRSYGSATCDGLLALQACGVDAGSRAFQSAITWLKRNAAGVSHGGIWSAGREAEREGLRYYYAQAFAGVLAARAPSARFQSWAAEQRALLAAELLAAQRSDGSWANAQPSGFEDDPLVATAFAIRALTTHTG